MSDDHLAADYLRIIRDYQLHVYGHTDIKLDADAPAIQTSLPSNSPLALPCISKSNSVA